MNIRFSPWTIQTSNSLGVFKQPIIGFSSIVARPNDFRVDDFN